jgi:hypothetical protein
LGWGPLINRCAGPRKAQPKLNVGGAG